LGRLPISSDYDVPKPSFDGINWKDLLFRKVTQMGGIDFP